MPMESAPVETPLSFAGFEDVRAGIVRWPMSVIRLSGPDGDRLTALADRILRVWRAYTDTGAGIYASTGGEEHNTITPIARMRGGEFEMDLVLRCNITSLEHPLGVFHPHKELHHIKRENIGLIEVMGLAVLPGRLKAELDGLADAMLSGADIEGDPALSRHARWAREIMHRRSGLCRENIDAVLREETGLVFKRVLEDAGVFKRNEKGRAAFLKFIDAVNEK